MSQFLERHVRKNYRPNPLREATRRLNKYLVEPWGTRRLESITRADIRALLDKVEAPVAANRLHSIVRAFFSWAVQNDLIAGSPVTNLRAPNVEKSRDRILSDVELRAIWHDAERQGYPYGDIVKLLILTGQRRGEVAAMEWPEVDLQKATWTLPAIRVKNGRLHDVPLSRQVVDILKELPRIGNKYVFTVSGKTSYATFENKNRIAPGLEHWTLHDLRRTAASGMARLGVNLVVIEKVLNHVSGSLAGIVGVYQRHEFAAEKRTALQLWADHIGNTIA